MLSISKERLSRNFVPRAMPDPGVDGGEGIVIRAHEHGPLAPTSAPVCTVDPIILSTTHEVDITDEGTEAWRCYVTPPKPFRLGVVMLALAPRCFLTQMLKSMFLPSKCFWA